MLECEYSGKIHKFREVSVDSRLVILADGDEYGFSCFLAFKTTTSNFSERILGELISDGLAKAGVAMAAKADMQRPHFR